MARKKSDVIWNRQERETDAMWATFMMYRDWAYPAGPLGAYRPRDTVRIAAECGLSESTLRNYASKGDWAIRAASYDADIEEGKYDRSQTAIQRMRVRGERALIELHEVLSLERAKLLQRALDPAVPALTVKELTSMQALVLKHEEAFAGLAEKSPKTKSELDLASLSEGTLDGLERDLRAAESTTH